MTIKTRNIANSAVTEAKIAAGTITTASLSATAGITSAQAVGAAAVAANKAATYFPRVACAVYDFAVDGGAQGQITPVSTVTIPAGSVIMGAWFKVSTAAVGATATVSADLKATADLIAATAVTSLSDDAVVVGKVAPDANGILTVADTTVKVTIATADLTAGVIEIIVLYACGVEGAS